MACEVASAMAPEGSVMATEERAGGAPDARDARMRALGKLHEASGILLTAGDLAGMRAVHEVMGMLLKIAGRGSHTSNGRETGEEVGARVCRVG